jgi:hypothetical protein
MSEVCICWYLLVERGAPQGLQQQAKLRCSRSRMQDPNGVPRRRTPMMMEKVGKCAGRDPAEERNVFQKNSAILKHILCPQFFSPAGLRVWVDRCKIQEARAKELPLQTIDDASCPPGPARGHRANARSQLNQISPGSSSSASSTVSRFEVIAVQH